MFGSVESDDVHVPFDIHGKYTVDIFYCDYRMELITILIWGWDRETKLYCPVRYYRIKDGELIYIDDGNIGVDEIEVNGQEIILFNYYMMEVVIPSFDIWEEDECEFMGYHENGSPSIVKTIRGKLSF
jgi:hypothetical protein